MCPRLLHIFGPIWIHSYGVMIAVGFLFFVYFLYKNPKRIKLISDEVFLNTLFIGLLAGIVGGRIIFALYEWDSFKDDVLQVFYPWVGGFGILGSVVGVLISTFIYLKIKKIKVLSLLDVVAIYAPLMEGFGRIGCFLAGCCYGKVTSADCFFSVVFKNPDGLAPLGVSLHPTQLYSSLAAFFIFAIIYFRAKFFRYKDGELLFLFLILLSVSRIVIDFFRGDRDFVFNFSLFSYYQLVALAIIVFSSLCLAYIRIKK